MGEDDFGKTGRDFILSSQLVAGDVVIGPITNYRTTDDDATTLVPGLLLLPVPDKDRSIKASPGVGVCRAAMMQYIVIPRHVTRPRNLVGWLVGWFWKSHGKREERRGKREYSLNRISSRLCDVYPVLYVSCLSSTSSITKKSLTRPRA